MIGYLQGTVIDTDGKKAIILAQTGIGYEINYGYFLEKNSKCELYIHHHISENDQSLWGFNSLEDKKMFELLKTVNKVGSSKAYPLISVVGTEAVIQAIMFDQAAILSKAPGIGKKMGEQIILSLKDKIDNFQSSLLKTNNKLVNEETTTTVASVDSQASKIDMQIMQEAMLALDSLGYKDVEITALVKKHLGQGVTSSAEIIKHVLREL